jgi:hypothetical protein
MGFENTAIIMLVMVSVQLVVLHWRLDSLYSRLRSKKGGG